MKTLDFVSLGWGRRDPKDRRYYAIPLVGGPSSSVPFHPRLPWLGPKWMREQSNMEKSRGWEWCWWRGLLDFWNRLTCSVRKVCIELKILFPSENCDKEKQVLKTALSLFLYKSSASGTVGGMCSWVIHSQILDTWRRCYPPTVNWPCVLSFCYRWGKEPWSSTWTLDPSSWFQDLLLFWFFNVWLA